MGHCFRVCGGIWFSVLEGHRRQPIKRTDPRQVFPRQ
jgi:hypothetical protein